MPSPAVIRSLAGVNRVVVAVASCRALWRHRQRALLRARDFGFDELNHQCGKSGIILMGIEFQAFV